MSNQTELKIPKWPFLLGDAVLLGCAGLVYARHIGSPLSVWETALFVLCGIVGAVIAIIPFMMEYRAAAQMVETSAVVSTVAQLDKLNDIAAQIKGATSQWQNVQELSARTAGTAKEIAAQMAKEAVAFTEFLQKANDGERANLRLENEKLRRGEGEFLQIIVRILDHTYALHQAALRSGQPGLIEQLGHFQNSCRDVVRRIGLVPFVPAPNDPFDAKLHKTPDAQDVPPDARVLDALATGYTYQGQLIRLALVSLQSDPEAVAEPNPDAETEEAPQAADVSGANGEAVKEIAEVEEQTLL
jgi:molecular chaperone GrpE (heat shock protein)